MSKIGILTFHKSVNYGSVLQAYALSKLLADMGNSVEIINYEPSTYNYLYGTFRNIKSIHDIWFNLKRLIFYKKIKIKEQKFSIFRRKYLPVSKENYTCKSNLDNLNNLYDVIICGSDQIWNVRAIDCDEAYFLPIEHKSKKIAYAASINDTDFTEERCNEKFKALIEDFDLISIRENSGTNKLKKYLNDKKEIYTTIDPTLLLSKSKYEEISSKRIIKEPYIFMYSVNYNDYTISSTLEIAEKLGLPVYTVSTNSNSFKILALKHKVLHCISDKCSPNDFLSYIQYAELVITNSFHGTAFSLIFEKNFFTINDVDSLGKPKNDERLCNILSYLGLKDHLITKEDIKNLKQIKKIDYNKVEKKKKELVNESMQFIYNALDM